MTSLPRDAAPWGIGLLFALAALLSAAPAQAQAQARYGSTDSTGHYDARQDGVTSPYCCSGQDRVPAADPADWVDPCNIDRECPHYSRAPQPAPAPLAPPARYQTSQYQTRGAMAPCPADRLAQIGCPPAPRAEGLTLPASFFYGGGGVGPDYIGGGEGGGVVVVIGGGWTHASARASSSVSIRIGGGGRGGGGGHGHPGKPGGGGCGCGH
jgi:hypothetical protein